MIVRGVIALVLLSTVVAPMAAQDAGQSSPTVLLGASGAYLYGSTLAWTAPQTIQGGAISAMALWPIGNEFATIARLGVEARGLYMNASFGADVGARLDFFGVFSVAAGGSWLASDGIGYYLEGSVTLFAIRLHPYYVLLQTGIETRSFGDGVETVAFSTLVRFSYCKAVRREAMGLINVLFGIL